MSKNKKKKNKILNNKSLIVAVILGALVIALIAVLVVNTGCSGLAGAPKGTGAAATTEETQIPVLVETDSNGQPIETAEGGGNGVEIDHHTLIENDECKVYVTGVDVANANGFSINVNLENKSQEDTFIFSIEYATIDGLTIDPFWACTVDAGSEAQSVITFIDKNLDPSIRFTDIMMMMKVNTEAEWESKSIAEQIIHVYPYGEDAKTTYNREGAATDVVIVDGNGVKATVVNCSMNDVWGYTVKVYLENSTAKDLFFSASDVSLNGKQIDPNWGVLIPANSTGYSSIRFDKESVSMNGIDSVNEIKMTVVAANNADWTAAALAREKVVIEP